jgi:hypothetical protein
VGGDIPLVRTDSQEEQNFEAGDADSTGNSGIRDPETTGSSFWLPKEVS